MEPIIYKTQPRLFILGMTFLGFAFFGFLFLLTFRNINDDYNILIVTLLVFFAILSLTFLFYFLTIKTIKLTKHNLVISPLLSPFSKSLNFSDIKNITQTKKEVKAVYGVSWTPSYIYTDIKTSINLVDNKLIKLNSIGQIDFDEFHKTFNKLRRGEGKIKEQKRNFILYLVDNFDGIIWIILLLILTTGLGYRIFTKQ